ncbi:MAG TPA: hypothetical protein VGA86_09365 [Desulfatiglandales bacterium]
MAKTKLDQWAIGIFSFVPRAPGLLISRSYGRVMPARFASRLAIRRALPPPSLFASPSLGAIGSPTP